MRKTVFILLLIAQGIFTHAQSPQDIPPEKPSQSLSPLNNFQVVGYVPEFLKLTLDFSQDNNVRIMGIYPAEALQKEEELTRTGVRFIIKEGDKIVLGKAVLISNIEGSYSILARSSNNGQLIPPSRNQTTSICYSLVFGGKIAKAEEGIFRFTATGKSSTGGIRLDVGIILDKTDPLLPHLVYTDDLSFSIVAN
ncbi:MAG: hypothetical protein CVV53_04110 [Spirochaetae bacterium HGW-Spirochaetae-9]|nr:MAG: hypothetical protein CVV53_04110 [Spirochaetae bacterium HGW-Spirochaetae-9]